ncbi:MAG: GGDEF domain-containing protein [Lachnospiraceae bacterium]|nr:GGDEF domain-containing protein [Lachnospiraceae bacterium]
MSFDYKEYSEAMDEFLIQMGKVQGPTDPEIGKAMSRLCRLLRISKVEVYFYETARDQMINRGDNACFYSEGVADENRCVSHSETAGKGSVATYRVYPFAGGTDWNELEQDKILLMSKVLFVYNGRRQVLDLVEKLIYKDPDMDIYNLTYFKEVCETYIRNGNIGNYGAGYFNLRRFANVNRQLGRDNATEVMAAFISGLQNLLAEGNHVCRIGGDNFAVLFGKDKFEIVQEYLKGQGVVYDEKTGGKVFISATVGYYLISEDVKAATEIMDNISVAFNQAKNVINEPYIIYTEELDERIKEAKSLEELFPEALANEEFVAYYQPKVALKDYTLAGAEALCRWFHDGEMVMPGKFIPVFERTKLVTMLDFYMLERVCKDIRMWLDEGKKVVKVSVNFSRRHLGDMNLVDHIVEVVDRYQVPHEYIEIELTESTTDGDFQDLCRIVTGLQRAGFKTSVDDFGMGYSSLNLIKELPWNVLKIDRSLLEPIASGEQNGSIMLTHVISMAQEMGLECIVEGVETTEQIKFLKQHNCYLAQGFFFDKPLPKGEFEKRLNDIQN